MKTNWSASAGWALMGAAVLLLAVLGRLELLLLIVPLSVLFSLARARSRRRLEQD